MKKDTKQRELEKRDQGGKLRGDRKKTKKKQRGDSKNRAEGETQREAKSKREEGVRQAIPCTHSPCACVHTL